MHAKTLNRWFLAAAALTGLSTIISAQTSRQAVVSIAAHDSAGAPISAAEITVTRGIKDVVARGTTDDNGHALLSFETKDSVDLQVTMRKIGYPRGDLFFAVGPRDTALARLVVDPLKGNQLAAMKTTAKSENPWTSYHLSADDIESYDHPLWDGWDTVKKLRPDMLTSHGGCDTGVQNIWVNGKRIVLPLPPTGIARQTARVGAPPRARFSMAAVSVLSEIAPEHIEEVIYKDCFDASMAVVGSRDAIFVVLKPGIAYQRDVGSFVDESYGKPAEAKK